MEIIGGGPQLPFSLALDGSAPSMALAPHEFAPVFVLPGEVRRCVNTSRRSGFACPEVAAPGGPMHRLPCLALAVDNIAGPCQFAAPVDMGDAQLYECIHCGEYHAELPDGGRPPAGWREVPWWPEPRHFYGCCITLWDLGMYHYGHPVAAEGFRSMRGGATGPGVHHLNAGCLTGRYLNTTPCSHCGLLPRQFTQEHDFWSLVGCTHGDPLHTAPGSAADHGALRPHPGVALG